MKRVFIRVSVRNEICNYTKGKATMFARKGTQVKEQNDRNEVGG